jgi:caa(3)-type oxidase subunit IV
MNSTSISIRRLVEAYAVLLVLLGATVAASLTPLGAMAVVVALLIAMMKTVVIAARFMHLDHAAAVVRTFAVVGLVMAALLISMVIGDAVSRMPSNGQGSESRSTSMICSCHLR